MPDLKESNPLTPPVDGIGLLTPQDLFSKQDWEGEKTTDGRLKASWERDGFGLPLASSDPVHGLFLARSSNDRDALFMMFEARPDLRGVGHQHHDSGHFYLAALGEMWAVEAGAKNSYSPDHNTILIDGRGHADISAAPRVKYLGASVDDSAAMASADLKNAYDYGWTCPMHFSWLSDDNRSGLWKLQPDTDPDLVAYYRGTQNFKMRLWGSTYWDNNWGPAMRIEGNPVEHAFRSAGIVRGKHPYALVVDDIAKDGREHLYEWLMQVPDNVRMGGLSMPSGSVPAVLLHKIPGGETWRMRGPENLPQGTPALIVCLLDAKSETSAEARNVVATADLPYRLEQQAASGAQPEQTLTKNRLVISRRAVDPHFKVALVPFRVGDKLPSLTWDAASGRATFQWPDQTDVIEFSDKESPTRFTVSRDGKQVAASPR
jgi:hypothetical protein